MAQTELRVYGSPKFGVAEFKKRVESKGPKRGRMYRTPSDF
jgi:hypothetical protein